MTCIAGIAKDGHVYIGGDSASSNGYNVLKAANGKVFRLGEFIFGCSGNRRTYDLLRFSLTLPPLAKDADLDAYMAKEFATAVRAALLQGGALGKEFNSQESFEGNVLVGIRGTLYHIDAEFAALRLLEGFGAVGSGAEVALGALHVTTALTPEERVKLALEAAERWTDGVRSPFIIESL